jgi:hypothetical protein
VSESLTWNDTVLTIVVGEAETDGMGLSVLAASLWRTLRVESPQHHLTFVD